LADVALGVTKDVPTLIMHGEDDEVVPIKASSKKTAKRIKGAEEIYYPGRPAS